MQERVVLYGLIVGLQPSHVLEIGTFRGGSTMIICAALDDLGRGAIVCVEPDPQVSPAHLDTIAHRTTIVTEPSPRGLPSAREVAGENFEFALIDGDHSYAGVVSDVEATIPVLADQAWMLFHDAHNLEVQKAIDDCLAKHSNELTDAGLVSRAVTQSNEVVEGHPVKWGGLRLIVFERSDRSKSFT